MLSTPAGSQPLVQPQSRPRPGRRRHAPVRLVAPRRVLAGWSELARPGVQPAVPGPRGVVGWAWMWVQPWVLGVVAWVQRGVLGQRGVVGWARLWVLGPQGVLGCWVRAAARVVRLGQAAGNPARVGALQPRGVLQPRARSLELSMVASPMVARRGRQASSSPLRQPVGQLRPRRPPVRGRDARCHRPTQGRRARWHRGQALRRRLVESLQFSVHNTPRCRRSPPWLAHPHALAPVRLGIRGCRSGHGCASRRSA